eukprot:scaffold1347_cov350-Pavlova_lutheri.AAC.73
MARMYGLCSGASDEGVRTLKARWGLATNHEAKQTNEFVYASVRERGKRGEWNPHPPKRNPRKKAIVPPPSKGAQRQLRCSE